MNIFFIFSIILGIIHKLYDDLYDNNLYEYFNIKKENIKYLNEFLKSLFLIGFTILSIHFLYFYIFFITTNSFLCILKKNDFGPYEFSGLMAIILLIPPFLNWKDITKYRQDFIYVLFLFLGCFIMEKVVNVINSEYSYTKLTVRLSSLLIFIVLLFLNYKFNIFTDTIIIISLFIIGYLLTSCIFQCILLNMSKSNKIPNKIKKAKNNKRKKQKLITKV